MDRPESGGTARLDGLPQHTGDLETIESNSRTLMHEFIADCRCRRGNCIGGRSVPSLLEATGRM